MTTEHPNNNINTLHDDLKTAMRLVYDACGIALTNPILNAESKEYGACSFELNGHRIEHRVSKITPTKTGQFVTIWKRNTAGITEPFHVSDDLDFIIITVRNAEQLGQFIFPKTVLAEKGLISQSGKEGKRGTRLYAPWDLVTSKQAEKTQNWQKHYFMTIQPERDANLSLAKTYFVNY